MTEHIFGEIVGDEALGGIFSLGEAVLLGEFSTLAVDTISGTEHVPTIVLQLHGRINKSKEKLTAAYVMAGLNAGAVAKALYDACKRIGPEGESDFRAGWEHGSGDDTNE
jgi:hypothetical protein